MNDNILEMKIYDLAWYNTNKIIFVMINFVPMNFLFICCKEKMRRDFSLSNIIRKPL